MWVRLSGGKSVHELWEMYCHHYGLSQAKSGCKGKAKGVEPIAEEAAAAMDKTAPLAMGVKPIPVYNAAPRLPPPDRTEVVIDQETEPMAPGSPLAPSLAATIDSESSYSPFPFRGESALAEVFTKRLKKLTFDGVRDGRRFIKVVCSSHVVWIGTAWLTLGWQEFEALIGRVNPEMEDDDKRLLLVRPLTICKVKHALTDWPTLQTTCFVGPEVNNWYEEADLDDDWPYVLLVEQLQLRFKGKSNRKTALIDRDAKLS